MSIIWKSDGRIVNLLCSVAKAHFLSLIICRLGCHCYGRAFVTKWIANETKICKPKFIYDVGSIPTKKGHMIA